MLESIRRCRGVQWCTFLTFLTGQIQGAHAGLAAPDTATSCSAQAVKAAREAEDRAMSFGPEGSSDAASAFAEAAGQYARQEKCLVDVPEKRAARVDAVELQMKMAIEAFRKDPAQRDTLSQARASGQALIAEFERMYGESATARPEYEPIATQIAEIDGLLPSGGDAPVDRSGALAVHDGKGAAKPRVPRGLVAGLAVSASVAAVALPFSVVTTVISGLGRPQDTNEDPTAEYERTKKMSTGSLIVLGAALVPTIVLAVFVARARKAKTGVVARRGLGGYVLPTREGVAIGMNWRF